jgi:hypothetical protein
MTPTRLIECLAVIRWKPEILARAIDVPLATVRAWTLGTRDIPLKVASWLEALCFVHEAAEDTKPATGGEGFDTALVGRHEHVPVYSYNLLRRLGSGPVKLRRLFGSDDEGAVFFLVSRGLATREADALVISELGRSVGSVVPAA